MGAILLRVLAGLLVLVVALAAGAAGYRAFRQHQLAQDLALTGPQAIDEAGFVRIGGIEQWVSIRGEDRRNPVLVVLHGGPGSAFQIIGYQAMRPWERDFTVVQWDQRGAGRTFGRNGPEGSGELSIDRMANDGVEVIQHALRRTGQPKAVVLGVSWGSILGVQVARRRPDLVAAYVGAGQVVDMADNETVGYEGLVTRLRDRGEAKALAKLQAIGAPPYPDMSVLLKERQILMAHPPKSERGMFPRLALAAAVSPGTRLQDIRDWMAGAQFSIDRLYAEMTAYSDHTPAPFAAPVVIIQGDEDIQTPTVLARDWFGRLQAPSKDFVTLPGGGHNAVLAMPEVFHAALREHVRPLVAR